MNTASEPTDWNRHSRELEKWHCHKCKASHYTFQVCPKRLRLKLLRARRRDAQLEANV